MRKSEWIGLCVGVLFAVCGQQASAQLRSGSLTSAERDWIVRVRIDEKLARDAYLTLNATWGDPVFANIAASEQKHMDAVKKLIDKYQLVDPVAGLGVGAFPTQEWQDLYDELVASGRTTLVAAYDVGILIEELDISDLSAALRVVQKFDVRNVFTNLLAGSLKHLDAFEAH